MIEHVLYQEDLNQINQTDLPWPQLEGRSVLITGASGLVGSVLVDAMIHRNENYKADIEIWVLARKEAILTERFGRYFRRKYFHFIIQDVSNEININRPIDYIVHCASKSDPDSFTADPVGVMNANYIGMYRVLEAAAKMNTKKVLFISSGEVYGRVEEDALNPESKGIMENGYGYLDVLNARSCYASSKKAAETLCVAFSRQYGTEVSIARLCHTYGASMLGNDSRAVSEFLRSALNHRAISLKSEGSQLRSYCYVPDSAAALLYILFKGDGCSAYNIANRYSTATIRELAEITARLAGTELERSRWEDKEKLPSSDISYAVLDATRLENLGWVPRYGLREGLERSLQILSSISGM